MVYVVIGYCKGRSKGDPLSCVHKSRQIISRGILLGTHNFYEQELLIALFHTLEALSMKQTLTFFPYISYPDAEISFKSFFPSLGIAIVNDFFFLKIRMIFSISISINLAYNVPSELFDSCFPSRF